jgi:hypothetical protein
MSRFQAVSVALVFGALSLTAGAAWALDNDPQLNLLCTIQDSSNEATPCGATPTGDSALFKGLSRDYGLVLAPTLLAPAETMGINGFQFDFQVNVTQIDNTQLYWPLGIEDGQAPPALVTTRLGVRKGLPYSLEVGMNATYLMESELWGLGGMVKWAINESVDDFPVDVAVRGSINRVVGSTQLDLTVAGMDVVVGHDFGLGGVLNLSPYFAYSPVWIVTRSGVIDATPGKIDDPESSFVFGEERQQVNRYALGFRFILGTFNFTIESVLAGDLVSYNSNIGVSF